MAYIFLHELLGYLFGTILLLVTFIVYVFRKLDIYNILFVFQLLGRLALHR